MKKKYLLIGLLLTFGSMGCSSLYKRAKNSVKDIVPLSTTLDISVTASNTSTPLVVYFFQLKSDEAFRRLDYSEVMKAKRTKLDGDIIKYSKVILAPSQTEERHIKFKNKVNYYAVVVGFPNVTDNDNWRVIKEIEEKSRNVIEINLNENSME